MLFFRASRRLALIFLALSGLLSAQCYDIRSPQVYEVRGHFEEWWDHPIWNANPGEGNFHLESDDYAGALQFALFSIGIVGKTSAGWTPYRSKRTPVIWADPTPQRSGSKHYVFPYQIPPSSATFRLAADRDVEHWSVTAEGLARYERSAGGRRKIVESLSPTIPPPDDLAGFTNETEARATLNLNTHEFTFEQRDYAERAYLRRIPGGVKLWRIQTMKARVEPRQVSCPASLEKVSLSVAEESEMTSPPPCVVKVKEYSGSGDSAVPTKWDFLENPENVSSPQGCVWVFESKEH